MRRLKNSRVFLFRVHADTSLIHCIHCACLKVNNRTNQPSKSPLITITRSLHMHAFTTFKNRYFPSKKLVFKHYRQVLFLKSVCTRIKLLKTEKSIFCVIYTLKSSIFGLLRSSLLYNLHDCVFYSALQWILT